jgi:hypothetical protein
MLVFLGIFVNACAAYPCGIQEIIGFKTRSEEAIRGLGENYATAESMNRELIELYKRKLQAELSLPEAPDGYNIEASPATFILERGYDSLIGLKIYAERDGFFCSTVDLVGEQDFASILTGDVSRIFDNSFVRPEVIWFNQPERVAMAAFSGQDDSMYLPNFLLFVKRSGSRFGVGWTWVSEDLFDGCHGLIKAEAPVSEIRECFNNVLSRKSAFFDGVAKEYWGKISAICGIKR